MRLPTLDSRPDSDGKTPPTNNSADGRAPAAYQFRAGGQVLSLFSSPLHGSVLRGLADGPMRLTDLRKAVGGPPQTTLRSHLEHLIGIGALEKRSRGGKSNMVENALTPVGLELLFVSDVLGAWLVRAPDGAISVESEAGRGAIKAFVRGWSSTMLRALAARPFSLTELDNLITSFNYPALERRLSAMHLAGHVAAMQGNGNGTPYAVTDWLRQGVAPLLASVCCERRHLPTKTAPLTRIDVEAILLLAMPLVALAPSSGGVCQLAVDIDEGSKQSLPGVQVTVTQGSIASCSSKLEPNPATSARGSIAGWFSAILDGEPGQLRVSGDRDLALELVAALRRALYS
jgi:DNA-binding HxlR family transcriptional regulator